MISLHPNILKRDGKKEFAILPYKEYEKIKKLLEDYEDILSLRKAKAEEADSSTISLVQARKIFKIDWTLKKISPF